MSRDKRNRPADLAVILLLALMTPFLAYALDDSTSVQRLNPTPAFKPKGLQGIFVCGFGWGTSPTGFNDGACALMTTKAVGYEGSTGHCIGPNMDPAVRGCSCAPGEVAQAMGHAGYFNVKPWDAEYQWIWCR